MTEQPMGKDIVWDGLKKHIQLDHNFGFKSRIKSPQAPVGVILNLNSILRYPQVGSGKAFAELKSTLHLLQYLR